MKRRALMYQMDSRFRGKDSFHLARSATHPIVSVIPANAGIQRNITARPHVSGAPGKKDLKNKEIY